MTAIERYSRPLDPLDPMFIAFIVCYTGIAHHQDASSQHTLSRPAFDSSRYADSGPHLLLRHVSARQARKQRTTARLSPALSLASRRHTSDDAAERAFLLTCLHLPGIGMLHGAAPSWDLFITAANDGGEARGSNQRPLLTATQQFSTDCL